MTVPPGDAQVADYRRLASASSLANIVAGHVNGLAPLRHEELPDWLQGLGVPTGWRIAHLEGAGVAPARMAVCRQQPGGVGRVRNGHRVRV